MFFFDRAVPLTGCTLFMVLYLCHMCQCGLHTVLWSHISILMHHLTAKPYSAAGALFPCQCPCGLSCWPCIQWVGLAGFKSRVNAYLTLLDPFSMLDPFLSSAIFPFFFFLSISSYCVAVVFGLIGCISFSVTLAVQNSLIIIIIIEW